MGKKKLSDLIIQDYIVANKNDDVGDIKEKWRKLVLPARVGHIIYVVDDEEKLLGLVDLRDIFTEKSGTPIKKIMKEDICSVDRNDPLSEAVRLIITERISEIPVVEKKKLVGMILSEDLLNNVQWENKKTFYNMAGIIDSDGDKLTLKNILNGVKNRALWLIVAAFLGVFLAGGIINQYESALILFPAIAVFIPVLMATGGNIGAQTSTIFVRILSTKEPSNIRKLPRFFLSDFLIGSLLGILLGGVIAGSSYLMFYDVTLSNALFVSTLCISIFAVVVGFTIPVLSERFKIDPALTSGPLVTTIKDVVALLIYFFIVHALYI